MRILIAMFFSCFFAIQARADVPAELRAAFDAMPKVQLEQWRFTETQNNGEETRVRSHDPRRNPAWVLESVNGSAPDEKALEEHAERLQREAENDEGRPGSNDFNGLAEPGSWKLLSETASKAEYQFTPSPDDQEDTEFIKHIIGTLTLNRDTGTVDHFVLKSIKPFRAKLVAKIKSFRTRIDMQRIADGVFFPALVSTQIRGRAFGLKKIDADVEVRFSDFQRITPDSL